MMTILLGMTDWAFSRSCPSHVPRLLLGAGQSLRVITLSQGSIFCASLLNAFLASSADRITNQLPNFNKCAFLATAMGALLSLWKGSLTLSEVRNFFGATALVGGLIYSGYQWQFPSLETLKNRLDKASEREITLKVLQNNNARHADVIDYLQRLEKANFSLEKLQEWPKEWERAQEWIKLKGQILKPSLVLPTMTHQEEKGKSLKEEAQDPQKALEEANKVLNDKVVKKKEELSGAQQLLSTLKKPNNEQAAKEQERLVDRLTEEVGQKQEIRRFLEEIIRCSDLKELEEIAKRGQEKAKPPEKEAVEKAKKAIETIKKEGAQKSAIQEYQQAEGAWLKAKAYADTCDKDLQVLKVLRGKHTGIDRKGVVASRITSVSLLSKWRGKIPNHLRMNCFY